MIHHHKIDVLSSADFVEYVDREIERLQLSETRLLDIVLYSSIHIQQAYKGMIQLSLAPWLLLLMMCDDLRSIESSLQQHL
jgi:hypothetical protein